jgi:hypothetical protein
MTPNDVMASAAAVTVASSVFFMVIYFLSDIFLGALSSIRTLTTNNVLIRALDWIFF